MLTQNEVKRLFDCNNGELFWKIGNMAGLKAGGVNKHGYLKTKIHGVTYLNHRIVYLYHFGYIPAFLDHIDGNRTNNTIENLRPASVAENMHNSATRKDNKSGVKGVYWHKAAQKWVALISKNKTRTHLGCFSNIDDAKAAVMSAREKLHEAFANHGDKEGL